MNLIRLSAVAATAVLMVSSGCGEHNLAPVSGIVTLDGKPLVRGVVNFQPIGGGSENPGPGSNGITDQKGRFELKTPDGDVGAIVGEHKVRIYSRNAEAPIVQDSDPQPPVELVPSRYNYQSTLTFPVPAEGTDKADFQLQSD